MKNKKLRCLVLSFLTLLCGILAGCASSGDSAKESQERAKAFGEEMIGANLPRVIFANQDRCILLTDPGVFFYDFNEREITDFLGFEEQGFLPRLQGGQCTGAVSLGQGSIVCVYDLPETKSYKYDCAKKEGVLSDYKASDTEGHDEMVVSDEMIDAAISSVYILPDDSRLYMSYTGSDGKYADLCLAIEKGESKEEYYVFQ